MVVIARDTVVNSALVFKVLWYKVTLSELMLLRIQVGSPVTKRSLGNHVAAINPNVAIPAVDTGRFFCKFQEDILAACGWFICEPTFGLFVNPPQSCESNAFFPLRFDQTTVEMHFAEVKMGIVSLG